LIGHIAMESRGVGAGGKEEMPLRDALRKQYEITLLTKPLLQKAAEFSRDGLCELVSSRPEEDLYAYLPGRDLLDLARDFRFPGAGPGIRARAPPHSAAAVFHLQQPSANPDEVDLTVAGGRYRCATIAPVRHLLGPFGGAVAVRDRLSVYVQSKCARSARHVMWRSTAGEEREETGEGKTWLVSRPPLSYRFPLSARLAPLAQARHAFANGRRVLPRHLGQGVCAASHAPAKPRHLRLAARGVPPSSAVTRNAWHGRPHRIDDDVRQRSDERRSAQAYRRELGPAESLPARRV